MGERPGWRFVPGCIPAWCKLWDCSRALWSSRVRRRTHVGCDHSKRNNGVCVPLYILYGYDGFADRSGVVIGFFGGFAPVWNVDAVDKTSGRCINAGGGGVLLYSSGNGVMRRLLVTMMVLALVTAPDVLAAQGVGLPIGTTVEPIVLETLSGDEADLADYIGQQPLFIQFWALWCEQCKALEPKVAAAHERYGDRVKFLAVAVAVNQSKRSVLRYLEGHDLPFEFLWDGRGRAVRAFKAPTTSYVVVVNVEGSVVYTGVGVDQEFDEVLAQVAGSTANSQR